MKKALIIARFEFMEKIRTKAFFIYMVLFPVIIVAVTIVPGMFAANDKKNDITSAIGILDLTGDYKDFFVEELDKYQIDNIYPKYLVINLSDTFNRDTLIRQSDSMVKKGMINGYLLIDQDSIPLLKFRTTQEKSPVDIYIFEEAFNKVRTKMELLKKGVKIRDIDHLLSGIQISKEIIPNNNVSQKNFETIYFSSVVFLMLLFMLILFSGGLLIRSLVEEKSNRIMEILLSSCTTNNLLSGKVIGLSMLGMFQLFIWSVIALILLGGNLLPTSIFNNAGYMLIYFILGYLFFTSIFVGVGSIVNSEQEAQHFTSYLSLIMIVPLVIAIKVIQYPDSLIVRILSFIPFTSPPVMLLRLNIATPPLWEIILTIIILTASIYLTIFISSKVFRIGVLSYGKRPGIKELYRWYKER